MNRLDDVDPKKLGHRLKEARLLASITQEQAANKIEVARTTVVAIEKGNRKIRPVELATLCKLYNVSASQLIKEEKIAVDFAIRFRKDQRCDDNADASQYAVQLLTDLSNAAVELERILGRTSNYVWLPEQPLLHGNLIRQAEDAANSLRHRLGLGLAPINDIVSLFEIELGFRIFIRPIDSKISAAFAFDPAIGPCVLLNSKHPAKRRSFSVAHEGGHYISSRDMLDVYYDNRIESSREEKYANAFAREFLMPAAAIRQRFYDTQNREGKFSPRHLIILAHTFHVTPEAMCRCLETIKLLKNGTYDSLRERGFNGQAVSQVLGDQVDSKPLSLPPRLAFLAAEAYNEGYLSEGQLSDMLHLDQVELRSLLEAFDAGGLDETHDLS